LHRIAEQCRRQPAGLSAFGHLKAIAVDAGGQRLLKAASVGQDAGIVDANDTGAFIAAAKTRQWAREKSVRNLA
jgi:catalase